MKKNLFISVMSVIAAASLATCLTGCGSQTNEAASTPANQAKVANAQAADVKAVPLSNVEAKTVEEPEYIYGTQVDRMTPESWDLLRSDENQQYLEALKGNIVIANIDGNYVVTPEQYEKLKVMADEADWCGCFECDVLYGTPIEDPDTGCTWYTMSVGCFWQYYNQTYILTDTELTDWYGEGGTSLSNFEFDSVRGVQTRFGKITLNTPKA